MSQRWVGGTQQGLLRLAIHSVRLSVGVLSGYISDKRTEGRTNGRRGWPHACIHTYVRTYVHGSSDPRWAVNYDFQPLEFTVGAIPSKEEAVYVVCSLHERVQTDGRTDVSMYALVCM